MSEETFQGTSAGQGNATNNHPNGQVEGDGSAPAPKKGKFVPPVDLAARKRAAEKALKQWLQGRQKGDSLNFSSRVRRVGQAAYELIDAEHPELNDTDLLTYIMLVAAALIEAAPRPKYATLDGKNYTLIKGDLATPLDYISKFEEELLGIDLYPDDPQRTEKIAILVETTQTAIRRIEELTERLARLAMLPEIPSNPAELRRLERLAKKLEEVEATSTDEEKELWTLARKLLGPYLP